ncbi:MAG: hypothetical protein DRP35_08805 [Candidatus Zixiibacteriota bacterium]|nr:MAG: hypothetical protein DRP35_08805 [candidate division Zixibacteria bacterium]
MYEGKLTLNISERIMDLSPNDIRNFEFPSQMRGYDKDEVDSFLEQVAVAMEEIKQANLNFSMELDSVKGQLQGLRQFEDTIKSAAIDARRNADLTMENAKKEAESVLSEAKKEVEKTIESKSNKIQEIENHISQLELTRRSYMEKLKGLINSHLDIVDEISKSELPKEVEKDLLEITASNEVESEKRATVTETPKDSSSDYPKEQSAPDPLLQNESPDKSEKVVDEESAVDPELAAAISSFDRSDEVKPAQKDEPEILQEKEPEPQREKIDPSTGWLETERTAEEVPPEFIVNKPSEENQASKENDMNGLEVTQDQPALKEVNPLSENLADELDKVAAKFEEEMNKAEK